ncbi:MAG: hypothetical protein A2946_03430 [Candidatus Liptonbacteria bacterium RIFCSPLOWO2_01_FULL_53_13]|uniref:Uncharacterized protein n=1 Tax=Candidatus Liptonbacteria bacterium RIFCSPLOWO2_01_FULL_53_13 TaxID=1798651 RepID=A0A1G2CGJ9_9BACT|nr:MAG: hypothetical protein A2946_03430 [Candidatus Liptonbacteria bacterium RIFCSPLOWO2_01_FULL_53_13]
MKIFVRVTAGARKEKIEKAEDGKYAIWVKEKPKENEANFAVLRALAGHLRVPQSRIRLMQGRTSREKVFEISD